MTTSHLAGFDASQPGVANETFNGVMPHCKAFPFIRALVHTFVAMAENTQLTN